MPLQKMLQTIQQTMGPHRGNAVNAANQLMSNLMSTTNQTSFNQVLSEAMSSVLSAESSDQFRIQKNPRSNAAIAENVSLLQTQLIAQADPGGGVNQNAGEGNLVILNRVPIQMFLDKTIEALDNISKQEFRVNDLMDGFIEGRVSEDEVIVETAKFSLAMSMVTTIIQTSVQTFKEIQQIPV